MDLLFFVRRELLAARIDPAWTDEVIEEAWQKSLSEAATRALTLNGITNRVPFVIGDDWRIDQQTSDLFLLLSGQVLGRTSMESYARHVFRFLQTMKLEGGSIASVTKRKMADYKRTRIAQGISPRSWNTEASVLKSFFAVVAEFSEVRSDNPCDQINWTIGGASVAEDDPDFITLADFQRFRDEGLGAGTYGMRNVAFGNVLLTSAMRLNEGNSFLKTELWEPEKVNTFAGRSIPYLVSKDVSKGSKSRTVRITKSAYESMRAYDQTLRPGLVAKGRANGLYDADPASFWLNQSGAPIGKIGWGDIFRRASKQTGIKASPKTLRHTCAVYLLSRFLKIMLKKAFDLEALREEAHDLRSRKQTNIYGSIFGDPLRKVQKYLGHAHYETTFIYLDVLGSHHAVNDEALAVFDEVISAEEAYDVIF